MPDPRLQLTSQDLVYAAQACRAAARKAESDARDPKHVSSRQAFELAAQVYDELAEKCDRIATASR
jgi:hypothetical protein